MKNTTIYTYTFVFALLLFTGILKANDQHYFATPATLPFIFQDIDHTYSASWANHGIDKTNVFEFIDEQFIHQPYHESCIAVRVNHAQGFHQVQFEFVKKTDEVIEVDYYNPVADLAIHHSTDDPTITINGLIEKYYVFVFRKFCGHFQSGLYIIIVDMDRVLKGSDDTPSEYITPPVSSDITNPNNVQLQTFPNPFVEQATVQLELMEEQKVSVRIMDIARAVPVAILMEDMQLHPGQHTLEVDLKDLPAGMYSCLVQIDGQILEHRMVKLE